MKQAVVFFHRDMANNGYRNGIDYAQVHQAHDEVQVECRPEIAEFVKAILPAAIAGAGEHLGLRCPLAGTATVGQSWAETH